MSSKQNDNNNTIHLGNYEDFFILYMDNELSAEQRSMVDEFLAANPDLQAELEILMSTRLPEETFSFDKKELFAHNMKMNEVSDELLLYIDNELPAGEAKLVASKIASGEAYQLQYDYLLRTKLDPSEKISYPNKKELYRTTEKVVFFKPWMRVAAAAVVIAAMGVLYFNNQQGDSTNVTGPVAIDKPAKPAGDKATDGRDLAEKNAEPANKATQANEKAVEEDVILVKNERKPVKEQAPRLEELQTPEKEVNLIASIDATEKAVVAEKGTPVAPVDPNVAYAGVSEKELINKLAVTNPSIQAYNTTETPEQPGELTDNDDKGSVKGLLRKATRLFEKRTGIDPVNEDGRLLIGAVAVRLK